MAAVTVNSIRNNVDGSYREKFFNIDIASSADTLDTKFHLIKQMGCNDVAVTKMAASGGTITFTTTGAVTGARVGVIGL